MGLKKFFAKLLSFEGGKERHYSVLPGEDEKTREGIEKAQGKMEMDESEKAIQETEKAMEDMMNEMTPEEREKVMEKYGRGVEEEKKEDQAA